MPYILAKFFDASGVYNLENAFLARLARISQGQEIEDSLYNFGLQQATDINCLIYGLNQKNPSQVFSTAQSKYVDAFERSVYCTRITIADYIGRKYSNLFTCEDVSSRSSNKIIISNLDDNSNIQLSRKSEELKADIEKMRERLSISKAQCFYTIACHE